MKLYTLEEVSGILQVSVRQLRRWKSLGLLEIIHLGGSRRYPRVPENSLTSFINSHNKVRQKKKCKTPS